jgi:hypothetical protein
MVDYAFDGMTIGYAPDIDKLPGAYAKLCYGKGFDSGFQNTSGVTIKDTNFLGFNVVPYDTEKLHVELQWQKGWNIFNAPSDAGVSANLGDINWLGGVVTTKLFSDLTLFASASMSKTDPNNNHFSLPFYWIDANGDGNQNLGEDAVNGNYGLMYDGDVNNGTHSGSVIYIGGRYDLKATGTKIGAEFNHGSKYWIGMVPAGDDMWTSKLGTRGDVYEVYVIQEIMRKANTKNAKAFVRLGYQMYNFDYTGSNSWIGAPHEISKLDTTNAWNTQMFAPVDKATDIYATFEVQF